MRSKQKIIGKGKGDVKNGRMRNKKRGKERKEDKEKEKGEEKEDKLRIKSELCQGIGCRQHNRK